jgi:hypothetical protein
MPPTSDALLLVMFTRTVSFVELKPRSTLRSVGEAALARP